MQAGSVPTGTGRFGLACFFLGIFAVTCFKIKIGANKNEVTEKANLKTWEIGLFCLLVRRITDLATAVAGGRDGGRCDPTDDPEQLGGVRDRPGIRIEGQPSSPPQSGGLRRVKSPATTVDKAWSVGLLANLELAERPSDPPAAELTGLDLSGSFVLG